MVPNNLDEALHGFQCNLIPGKIKIAASQVWKNIDLLCRIVSKRKLPTCDGAANAAGSIQGQTQFYTCLRGLSASNDRDMTARFGRAAKLKDCHFVFVSLLKVHCPANVSLR